MRKYSFFVLAMVMLATSGMAQDGANTGKSNSIGAGFSLPIGDFADTHSFGFGVNYSWSNHRYGKMTARPANPIGFTFNAGLDYYFGKEVTAGNTTYDYPGYTYLHTYGGIMHNPCTNGFLELTAGPVLGLWDGGSEFGFGVNLGGSFGICRSMGINPFFNLMKHSDSDPIYSFGARVHYNF